MKFISKNSLLYVFILFALCLSVLTAFRYPGSLPLYLLFSFLLNALFLLGFRKNRIFFDTFIGVFSWLGYWLKLSVGLIFNQGLFNESGLFDSSPVSYDLALQVTCVGISGFILASLVRGKFFFSYRNIRPFQVMNGLFKFYQRQRFILLVGYTLAFVFIATSNVILGIYQKGSVSKTFLPFGLNGVYKWLLLFGLASFSALLIDFELRLKKNPYLVTTLALFESLFTSVSLLSRGMVLNISGLFAGAWTHVRSSNIIPDLKFRLFAFGLFCLLFFTSILSVNFLRTSRFSSLVPREVTTKAMVNNTKALLTDRFVGIEGVMAVSSYQKLGWELWKTAWAEKYVDSGTSFYDKNIINSPYTKDDLANHHFISLPGILAFFYYPGSLAFLFVAMTSLGFLASLIEFTIFKLLGSFLFCALIGQVIAYRYVHFGYVPTQSYLLFGSIAMNTLLFYFANLVLTKFQGKHAP